MISYLLSLISILVTVFFNLCYYFYYPISDSTDYLFQPNFIIVGGGPAGLTLALILSEITNVSVLLLEAGSQKPSIFNIPALTPLMQLSPYDWQFETVSQKNACFGLVNNRSKWPSGKVLGGSSHLNYMMYLRGFIEDFDSWKDPNTDHWSASDINYYFKKSINKCNKLEFSSFNETVPIFEALKELKQPINNLTLDQKTGFTKPLLTLNNGERWTFDRCLKNRPNLKIITNAYVEKVIIEDKVAKGVIYTKNSEKITINSTNEIILSAGTIGSSRLLMMSGIGPEKDLNVAKIPVITNLPVGHNLQDHVSTIVDITLEKSINFTFFDLLSPKSALEYFLYGRGPYTANGVIATGRLSYDNYSLPNIQLIVLIADLTAFDYGFWIKKALNMKQEIWDDYSQHLIKKNTLTILPIILHPKSLGEVKLDLKNINGPPLINPKYLSNLDDLKVLIEGIRFIEKLIETKTFKNLGAEIFKKSIKPCEQFIWNSDSYWDCFIRHFTFTAYHPVGTCKMGSVVDYKLRVMGVTRLRVVDASIMPNLPSANPLAAVLMIAEKGADLIIEDYYDILRRCELREIFIHHKYCYVN